MATEPTRGGEPTLDAQALYREEIYTDRKVGTLRVLVPVTSAGDPDPARKTMYSGEAQLLTNMGPLPISFDIEAGGVWAGVIPLRMVAGDPVTGADVDVAEVPVHVTARAAALGDGR